MPAQASRSERIQGRSQFLTRRRMLGRFPPCPFFLGEKAPSDSRCLDQAGTVAADPDLAIRLDQALVHVVGGHAMCAAGDEVFVAHAHGSCGAVSETSSLE